DEIVVVTGHDADAVEAVLPAEVRTVRNASFRDGQSTSLAAAIHALDERSEAAIVLMADQPGIRGTDIRAMVETFRATRARIARVEVPVAVRGPRVLEGIAHQGGADPPATVGLQHEHVAQPRHARSVGHHATEANEGAVRGVRRDHARR